MRSDSHSPLPAGGYTKSGFWPKLRVLERKDEVRQPLAAAGGRLHKIWILA